MIRSYVFPRAHVPGTPSSHWFKCWWGCKYPVVGFKKQCPDCKTTHPYRTMIEPVWEWLYALADVMR
jgi:hypothetical protein